MRTATYCQYAAATEIQSSFRWINFKYLQKHWYSMQYRLFMACISMNCSSTVFFCFRGCSVLYIFLRLIKEAFFFCLLRFYFRWTFLRLMHSSSAEGDFGYRLLCPASRIDYHFKDVHNNFLVLRQHSNRTYRPEVGARARVCSRVDMHVNEILT